MTIKDIANEFQGKSFGKEEQEAEEKIIKYLGVPLENKSNSQGTFESERGHTTIGFDNGYKVSIVNGFGSYTENHFNTSLISNEKSPVVSHYCEVAIIFKDNLVNPLGWNDNVKGYVSLAELLKILNDVSKL